MLKKSKRIQSFVALKNRASELKGKIFKNDVRPYSENKCLSDVYIISTARTPIGIFKGSLSTLSAVDLGVVALTAAVQKSNISKDDIQELIFGSASIHGCGQAPDYQIAKLTGLPKTTTTSLINKLCGSGLKTVMNASQSIECRINDVAAVVGAESPSNYPYLLKRDVPKYGDLKLMDVLFHDVLLDAFEKIDVTQFAEETAKDEGITREDQDALAIKSYERACQAQNEGKFRDEIVPVSVTVKGKRINVDLDENIKRFNLEVFKKAKTDVENGTITNVNSSGLADGAASMILASKDYVVQKNLKPLAKIISYADVALEERKFCYTPPKAIEKALKRANLQASSIDLWEISETFALTPLVTAKLLNIRKDILNIHGGAISLGHPFAMTGIRILGHLAYFLQPGQRGCAAMQNAAGGGTCVIVEKIDWGKC